MFVGFQYLAGGGAGLADGGDGAGGELGDGAGGVGLALGRPELGEAGGLEAGPRPADQRPPGGGEGEQGERGGPGPHLPPHWPHLALTCTELVMRLPRQRRLYCTL